MIRGLRRCRDADLAIAYRGLVRKYLRLDFLVFIGLVTALIGLDDLWPIGPSLSVASDAP
jgi:hypothetical protein